MVIPLTLNESIILKYFPKADVFTGKLQWSIGQFEAEKCLSVASTDTLLFNILDNRTSSWAIQMVKIPVPRPKVGAKPQQLPGGRGEGFWCLELTDA